ncbi:MAG: LemA family protein [Gammaproteobacteria bacterium]|nr:LemA family protein [Gammaproteobacteria bacterium]
MDIAAGIVVTALLVWGIVIYNRLITDRNRIRAAWSDIDVQLRRRHDLIPQLVELVKSYANYERKTLEDITTLRTRSEAADRVAEIGDIESELGGKVTQVMARVEDYPDLKANESFLSLQENLTDVEDHIQYARRYYNGAVRIFNTRIGVFPELIIARMFNFTAADFFQIEEESQRAAPRVN